MSAATPPPPSQEELEANSLPVVIRRAPRFARIVMTGVGAGAVLGILLGLGLPGRDAVLRGTIVVLMVIAFATIGGLVAGSLATTIDGKDPRRRAKHAGSRVTAPAQKRGPQ